MTPKPRFLAQTQVLYQNHVRDQDHDHHQDHPPQTKQTEVVRTFSTLVATEANHPARGFQGQRWGSARPRRGASTHHGTCRGEAAEALTSPRSPPTTAPHTTSIQHQRTT